MFKNYLEGIKGIATYPSVSLIVFFAFFTGLTIWLIRADKNKLEEINRMPLQDENDDSNPSQL